MRLRVILSGCFSATLVSTLILSTNVEAAERAGWTRTVQPASEQIAAGSTSTINQGDTIYQQGRILTQQFGSVGVALDDGSALTIGPNSNLVIDRFVYDPNAGSGDALIQLGVGALRMVSGNMPSDRLKIGTPVATVGIRGTDFTLETVGDELLKIFVDDGIVTAVTLESGLSYEFPAPAYVECTAVVCVVRVAGLRPRLTPPAPPGFSPFGSGGLNGADGGSSSGGNNSP